MKEEKTFFVEGHEFHLELEKHENSVRAHCVAKEERFDPLGNVVTTFVMLDPVKLFRAIRERHGYSVEGDVAFSYNRDYPEEHPEPGVTADYFEDSVVVSESFFENFARAFYATWRELAAELEIPFDDADPTRP